MHYSQTRPTGRSTLREAGLATLGAMAGIALTGTVLAREAEERHPPTGRFVVVDGVRLHVKSFGADRPGGPPPVLLLHGNGVAGVDMEACGLPDILAGDRRVIVVDRPGFGHSNRPRGRAWTLRAQGDLMLALIDRLGLDRPVVVAHSAATLAAVAMAVRAPYRLAGVVLLSGYYIPTARVDSAAMVPLAVPGLGDVLIRTEVQLLGRLTGPGAVKAMFAPLPVPAAFRRDFSLEMAVRPIQVRASAEEGVFMVADAKALQAEHARIRLPVIVMAGTKDAVVSTDEQSVKLASRLPNADLELVEGAGHMVHHAAPDRVANAVDRIARAAA